MGYTCRYAGRRQRLVTVCQDEIRSHRRVVLVCTCRQHSEILATYPYHACATPIVGHEKGLRMSVAAQGQKHSALACTYGMFSAGDRQMARNAKILSRIPGEAARKEKRDTALTDTDPSIQSQHQVAGECGNFFFSLGGVIL